MQAHGVPRLDVGAEGIHLLWTWPEVCPVSQGGYDIQRLGGKEERWESQCESIDRQIIAFLRARGGYPASLGMLRLRIGADFTVVGAKELYAAANGSTALPPEFGDPQKTVVDAALQRMLSSSPVPVSSTDSDIEVYTQELAVPAERVSVEVTGTITRGSAYVVIAMCAGKVVQVVPAFLSTAAIQLRAPSIDAVVIYALYAAGLQICAYRRPEEKGDGVWSAAPYIVKGLTLPLHETDPTLTNQVQEYAAAKARLIAGEALTKSNFLRMAATMRTPLKASALGRSGERIVLVRSDTTQSYEELSVDGQLAVLAIHPKMRRTLGFGYRDTTGLVPGQSYAYRITGRFRAEDLTDAIYDVHRVPTSTVLPAAVSIRDLSLRFQTPVSVVLDPQPSNTGLRTVSRRGIRIDTTGYDSSWLVPSFGPWSAVVDFPRPVTRVILEVATGHSFSYGAGLAEAFGAPPLVPLPAGPIADLVFGAPITQLRLAGTGTLYAVRLPSGATGIVEVHAYTAPITYAPQPLPASPVVLGCAGLQEPPAVLSGPIDESTSVPPHPPVGFKLIWLPASVGGLGMWPNDIDAGPPLDAVAYQIEHRRVELPIRYGPWGPITGDDNLTVGSRGGTNPAVQLVYGCDLDALFPAVRQRSAATAYTLYLSDVFGEKDPATGVVRAAEPLGSYHQYQIRAMDAVGRVSAPTTLSNVARLEKLTPPPLPVGPQPEATVDAQGHLTAPPGPRARAIINGAPGLTPEDIALLGAHDNAILLEWGWRQQERDLDPTTTEFRVYMTTPPDVVSATITAVSSAPPHWQVALQTSLPLIANELVGQWITCNGYPFRITQNDAGTTPNILVELSALQPATQPALGAVTFGRPLRPEHQNPGAWGERVVVYPITANDTYQHVFYDALTLDSAHPRAALWVGVSAADAQPYVPDQRTAGPNANRPGNESAIVACAISARYRGQPVFNVPPPLGDVPEIVTDEPTGRQVIVPLDVGALLGGALANGSPIALERCSGDEVISRASVAVGAVILTLPDGTQEAVAFANPGDEAAVIATLDSDNPQRLANKYLLHLVVAASDPTMFFERISDDIDQVGVVNDRLPPKPGRFLYLVRAADGLGHISDGGAILPAVVRVPSTAAAVVPQRRALSTTDTAATLTLAIGADPDTTTALLFAAISPPGQDPPVLGEAQLLRSPNRRDLYPNDGLRLLLSDGTLLSPVVAKNLGDPDVVVEADGTRVAALAVPAAKDSWATLWCAGLTRDGRPSPLSGPYGTGVHA